MSNSCGVLITYLGKIFCLQWTENRKSWTNFDVTLYADHCILINLYNANTETEQVKILEELQSLLIIKKFRYKSI